METKDSLKPLIKTLVFDKSSLSISEIQKIEGDIIQKWSIFRDKFKSIFLSVDPVFDKTINAIEQYFNNFSVLPSKSTILSYLSTKGIEDSYSYVSFILEDSSIIEIQDNDLFFSYLETTKVLILTYRVSQHLEKANDKFSLTKKTEAPLLEFLDETFNSLINLKDQVSPENQAAEFLLYGQSGIDRFQKKYEEILERKRSGEELYFGIPFECFSDVSVKPGDLYVTGGYTSQGKSVYLRYLSYHYLVNHAKNVVFFTLEMDASVIEDYFHIMHANNKKIFPNTPSISYTKFKKGNLDENELDFLQNVVVRDFCLNESYGTLKIYKPNKVRFTLDDLKAVIKSTQANTPVHVLSVDYLTLMYPTLKGSSKAQTEDYNQMIKEFKQVLLTNLDNSGYKAPIIGLTAAQISRQGYQECLKNGKMYNIAAFSMFNEIERSADILGTILKDPELTKEGKVKLQFLKNRDGSIPLEGKEFLCNPDFGGIILDARDQENYDLNEIIKELSV